MADQLNEHQIQQLRETFSKYDKKGDGSIHVKELEDAMKSLNIHPTPSEIKELLKEVNTDNSGNIIFCEFISLMARFMVDDESEMVYDHKFKEFDKDKDGYISPADLKAAMANLGEKLSDDEVNDMIRQADLDGDGHISFEEFIRMITK